MSSLQKFNDTLNFFDQEVEQLRNVSEVFNKLKTMAETYNDIIQQFEKNGKELSNSVEQQAEQRKRIDESFINIEKTNAQHKSELARIFEDKTEHIRKENKEFYRELESTIKLRLEDHKSQIKQLIESERNQIKQIFEIELSKHTKELTQVIELKIERQTNLIKKNQTTIKISLWLLGIVTMTLVTVELFT